MSFIQEFFLTILPESWGEDMQAESQAWMMRCPCGFERSIWEVGGIRWKARGSPRKFAACPQCGQNTWHTVYKKTDI